MTEPAWERFGYDPADPVPVDEDGRVMPDGLLHDLGQALIVTEMPSRASYARQPELTASNLRVLRCMAHGMTSRMAADALGIAVETVRENLKAARYRLRAKNTTHAVAEAIRRGLIP